MMSSNFRSGPFSFSIWINCSTAEFVRTRSVLRRPRITSLVSSSVAATIASFTFW